MSAPSRRGLEAYRLAVILGGAVLVAGAALAAAPAPAELLPAMAFALLGCAAIQYPLLIGANHKLALDTAVVFAAALLLPAHVALLVVAAGALGGWVLSAARKWGSSPVKPPLAAMLLTSSFNSAQVTVATWLAISLRVASGLPPGAMHDPRALWVIPAMAVVMYAANAILISVGIGLLTGRSPLAILKNSRSVSALQSAGLFLIGVMTAAGTGEYPWIPLVMVLPAAIIYISLKRTLQLAQETIAAVERMADVVDRRDHYTYDHSVRVAQYAVEIGRRLGFDAEQLQILRLASRVHDLGKIGVPDEILRKPSRLTAEERAEIERHPQMGFEILSEFSEYSRMTRLVITHHERYDGEGYPNRVRGASLPLLEQVMPVADSLDAMTSARPYRGPLSWEQAFAELRRGAGTQWNPKVVEATARLIEEQRSRVTLRPSPVAV